MSPLAAEICQLIALEGPMPVSRYMALCLGHPRFGYYMTRDPFGAKGDFTTAPEISQLFGEMLGVFVAEVFLRLGAPASFILAELGPGRGTLMADVLRVLAKVPGALAAAEIHLVETSPVLRAAQARTLLPRNPIFHEHVALLPEDRPMIVLANEFFDALGADQYVKTPEGWRLRQIGIGPAGALAFGLGPVADVPFGPAPDGAFREISMPCLDVMATLAARIAAQRGALLVIDYGHAHAGFGETFQAVKAHRFVSPLDDPGEADLTFHVDFKALSGAAEKAGVAVSTIVTQAEFLTAMGIDARAARLAAAVPAQAGPVMAGLRRLTGMGDGEMGFLFKALSVSSHDLGPLPGFAGRGV